jgi:hypothetical protein
MMLGAAALFRTVVTLPAQTLCASRSRSYVRPRMLSISNGESNSVIAHTAWSMALCASRERWFR